MASSSLAAALARRHIHYGWVVVGVTFPSGAPGFVLLSDHADLAAGDHGSGEDLEEHTCSVLQLPY